MPLAPNPIVVLGTFRGGTSCVAAAINHLGVFLGNKEEFQPAGEQNPGGFWELRDMQKLNAAALVAFGMDYFRARPLPDNWNERPGAEEFVEGLRKLLVAKFESHVLWGWKEPASTILMPLYEAALAKDGVNQYSAIICVRHPLSVAASQKSRYRKWGYTAELLDHSSLPAIETRTVGLWLHYTLTALRDTRRAKRMVISYESFLRDPRPYVDRIAKEMLDDMPNAEQVDAAAKSVDPDLSHSRFDEDSLAEWPRLVRDVYSLARRLDQDPQGFQSRNYDKDIDELYRQWQLTTDLVTPFELPAAVMKLVWREGEETKRLSHPYIQANGWQRISIEVDAPPASTIQIDPCQLPCRIWIRRAVWRVNGQETPTALKPGPNGILERLGMLRLSVFGPAALMVLSPQSTEQAMLEMEILVDSGETVLREMVFSSRKK